MLHEGRVPLNGVDMNRQVTASVTRELVIDFPRTLLTRYHVSLTTAPWSCPSDAGAGLHILRGANLALQEVEMKL